MEMALTVRTWQLWKMIAFFLTYITITTYVLSRLKLSGHGRNQPLEQGQSEYHSQTKLYTTYKLTQPELTNQETTTKSARQTIAVKYVTNISHEKLIKLIRKSTVNKIPVQSRCNMTKYLLTNKGMCNVIQQEGYNSSWNILTRLDNSAEAWPENDNCSIWIQPNTKAKSRNRTSGETIRISNEQYPSPLQYRFHKSPYSSKLYPLHAGDFIRNIDKSCDTENFQGNCGDIRSSYQYGKDRLSQEEVDFPLAFAMKIHSNANQANIILRYIYRAHNIYCIHVDKKATTGLFEMFKTIARCFNNIYVIEDRVNVVYSSIRQVEAEFRCMDMVLGVKTRWKYYINLTGQEFPLRTNMEIVQILKLLKGSNDIESYPYTSDRERFERRTYIRHDRTVKTKDIKPPFPRNIPIRKGSAYGMFSRDFIKFVRADSMAREFTEWLRDTYAPEETIFATLNALPGTPGGYSGNVTMRDNTFISRHVIWSMDKLTICQGKYVRWVCIYGIGDIAPLLSHPAVIANKFYADFEPLGLDCLEQEMYRRMMTDTGVGEQFDVSVYNTMPQLRRKRPGDGRQVNPYSAIHDYSWFL